VTEKKVIPLNQLIADAYLKVFDNKDGEIVLKHLEDITKKKFPSFTNVNYHYAISGQLLLLDNIRLTIRTARKQNGRDK